MAISLSGLANNLDETLRKGKSKDFKPCLKYVNIEDGLQVFKCVDCKKINK